MDSEPSLIILLKKKKMKEINLVPMSEETWKEADLAAFTFAHIIKL